MAEKRYYRQLVKNTSQVGFDLTVKETDLYIHAPVHLKPIARELVLKYRGYLESYIERYPEFLHALTPWNIEGPAPSIIRDMISASHKASVGPMAGVAGAIAEYVGKDLLSYTNEVIIENGGDIFIRKNDPVTIGIYAGKSPLSMKIGICVDFGQKPFSVCTSSGTVGHSLSFGIADAVCIVAESATFADAVATSVGNRVQSEADIPVAMNYGKSLDGVTGIVIILKDKIAAWGNIQIVPIR